MENPIKTAFGANQLSAVLFFIALYTCSNGIGQDTYARNASADVVAYVFHLTLNDTTNRIQGKAQVTVDLLTPAPSFALDLIEKTDLYGMEIAGVMEDGLPASYTYGDHKITIRPRAGNETRFGQRQQADHIP